MRGLNDVGPHNDLQYTGATDNPADFGLPVPSSATPATIAGIPIKHIAIGALLLLALYLIMKKGKS